MHPNGSNDRRGKGQNKLAAEGAVSRSDSNNSSFASVNGFSPSELKSAQSPSSRQFSFVIHSDFDESRVIQDQIMAAVTAASYPDNDVFAIKLALEEAMINAIKHGNKLDPKKRVRIEASVGHDQVEFMIHDEGAGFVKAEVPDPTLEENLEKNSGRGILLIEAYMSFAEWTDGGRKLRMGKKREAQLAAS